MRAISAARVHLAVDLPEQCCHVDVDPARFVQVLSNVVHNASKFTPPGGHISIVARPTADHHPPRVTITVADTGIGIAGDMLPRVFELFTQAESPTVRSHGGLGLGLALAKRLIELHGGTITGHSDGTGRGTTITITMPLSESVPAPASTPDRVTGTSSRVVVIDDNQDAAITLSMLIERLGGTTRVAYDATAGLAAVEEYQPDVVFLDIGMPGMDGYETCRRIRQLPARRPILVIALTGWGHSEDQQRAVEAGFDAHLTKPVDPLIVMQILTGNAPDGEPA